MPRSGSLDAVLTLVRTACSDRPVIWCEGINDRFRDEEVADYLPKGKQRPHRDTGVAR
jgi:hypothetical protein